MSSPDSWGFAPPPFNVQDAHARLQRELRSAGLTERQGVFERRGSTIARLAVHDDHLHADLVKRPARSGPEWQTRTLRNAAEVRDWLAELKKKLAAWGDGDD